MHKLEEGENELLRALKDQAVNILTEALKYEDLCRIRASRGVIKKLVLIRRYVGGKICTLAMIHVYIQRSSCINHIIIVFILLFVY